MNCKHPKNRIVPFGEFGHPLGCLDCGKAILDKITKKRKPRVTYPLPKCYISTRSGQYKRLEKDSKTLNLMIKYGISVEQTPGEGWAAMRMNEEWLVGKTIHTAVSKAAKWRYDVSV